MLRVGILRIHDHHLERFRHWMAELNSRVDEVKETFAHEETRHEQVHLVETSDGPLVFYVMEVDDAEASLEAFRSSTLPIDLEHKEVMREVVAARVPAEVLLDLSAED